MRFYQESIGKMADISIIPHQYLWIVVDMVATVFCRSSLGVAGSFTCLDTANTPASHCFPAIRIRYLITVRWYLPDSGCFGECRLVIHTGLAVAVANLHPSAFPWYRKRGTQLLLLSSYQLPPDKISAVDGAGRKFLVDKILLTWRQALLRNLPFLRPLPEQAIYSQAYRKYSGQALPVCLTSFYVWEFGLSKLISSSIITT